MSSGLPRRAAFAGALGLAALVLASEASADNSDVQTAARALLDAYASKNFDALQALTDPNGCVVIGSGAGEHETTPEQIRALLEADYARWESATFGPFDWIHINGDANFAAAIFQSPFTMHAQGQTMSVTLRFATAWRKAGGRWVVNQSMTQVVQG